MGGDLLCAGICGVINLILSVFLFAHCQGDRARIIYGCFTSYYALSCLHFILFYDHVQDICVAPLSFSLLAGGSFMIALFTFFPVEMLLPTKQYRRWIMFGFLIPSFFFILLWQILILNGMKVMTLSDNQRFIDHLNNASVTLRLVFALFIVLFFICSIIFMIWAHKRYMTDKILRIYAYATIPLMLIYIGFLVEGLTPELYMSHMFYIALLNTYVTYHFIVTDRQVEAQKTQENIEEEIQRNETLNNEMKEFELRLQRQLNELMEKDKLYCSSDLTLPDLARILGTNRTKLSELIRSRGFDSFPAYLNSYRLQEFIRLMNENENETIIGASSLAGFGSKASLYRIFTSVYGISPSEYLKAQNQPNN